MIYSAINIGPIISTLGMARKPRELWAASYMFSHLMKCIIEALPKEKIISPATFGKSDKKGIGLYPDRVFIKNYVVSYQDTLKPIVEKESKELHLDTDYFNVMTVSGEYNLDSEAIKDLNAKLNNLELFNLALDSNLKDKVRECIKIKYDSPLFLDAFGKKEFPVESLGEIAAVELKKMTVEEDWNEFVTSLLSDDQKIASKAYSYLPKEKLRSYHKYICVVQADGDNMGKAVSHSKLPDGKVKEISEALLKFGENAKKTIEDYGGFPIYAGGDDLLFIAPVVGKDYTNIFQLLKKLDTDSFGEVRSLVDECQLKTEDKKQADIHASLSFGVSITYYKYPLYEALESARDLLFGKAKNVDGKNAIALNLRKHSGGAFYMELSNSEIKEEKAEEKKNASDIYKETALKLLNVIFKSVDTAEDINHIAAKITQTMYAMLRVAKFIKGEEVRDE